MTKTGTETNAAAGAAAQAKYRISLRETMGLVTLDERWLLGHNPSLLN